tara:strand:- start:1093 stop:1383 length:291 start_codon:yes stop_codon:yes gene_type:complete
MKRLNNHGDRILFLCETLHISLEDFSKKLQMPFNLIEGFTQGNPLTSGFRDALDKYLPEVNRLWIEGDEEKMFNPIPEGTPVLTEMTDQQITDLLN